MILYFEKTGDMLEAPARNPSDGIKYPEPMPKKKVYEYIEPTYNPEAETLGEIIVVDDIATKKIIELGDWEHINYPIRITVKQNDLRYGEKLQNLAFDMLIDQPPQKIYWDESTGEKLKFVTVYLKYIYSKDKFELDTDTNIISANSSISDYMTVEQQNDIIFEMTTINGKKSIAAVRSE